MIVVTSYDSPDLDGVACSVGYAELLNSQGKEAKAVYIGELGLEVEFVKKYLSNLAITLKEGDYASDTQFILVDTADPDAIDKQIDPLKVLEMYDHRELVFTDAFKNAEKVIELVGSCATLIAEKFFKDNLKPSPDTALLLYSAIISNTINFLNTVTTDRDKDMANWLKQFINVPNDYIRNMFEFKSQITSENLFDTLNQDFAVKTVDNYVVGIAQLEVVDLEKKFNNLRKSFEDALARLKAENSIDLLLFTGIDVLSGFNIFFTLDSDSARFFDRVLEVENTINGAKSSGIIMRKQVWPRVKDTLEK